MPIESVEEALASVEARINQIARRYACPSVPLEDLCQEGRLGAIKALERFDPNYGVEYITYADHYIRSYIQHYFRTTASLIRIPAALQQSGIPGNVAVVSVSEWMEESSASFFDPYASRFAEVVTDALAFRQVMSELPPKWKMVIDLHYWHGLTFDEIGSALSITGGRASQIHQQALQRLRKQREAPFGGEQG